MTDTHLATQLARDYEYRYLRGGFAELTHREMTFFFFLSTFIHVCA